LTITLVSIVKNEEEALPRLLDSVKDLIDNYCIVDTGSTDDTVDVLESYGIAPHRREWVSFGHNLTEAFSLAKDRGNWLLRLDADMTVEYHPGLKNWLSTDACADGYNVELVEAGTSWRLPLLVRGGLEWNYVGPTHEYLDADNRSFRDLVGLKVLHHADGTNRAEKFERDIALLAEGVEQGDARSIFYTAESLRCLGMLPEAVEMFDRRSSMVGTWEEEAWYAEYRAGVCMLDIDPEDGFKRLLAAHNRRPSRAESLFAIENWCSKHRTRTLSQDALFVEQSAYL
jgi:glycosyltransferase involved in cell wall biosynthesis